MNGNMRANLAKIGVVEATARKWQDLERRARPSFFQSWGWVENWLRCLPPELRPQLMHVQCSDRDVGLGVLGYRRLLRRRIIPTKSFFLSEVGLPEYDALTIEHNGMLVENTQEREVVAAALHCLLDQSIPWDELRLSGLDSETAVNYLEACSAVGLASVVHFEKPYYFTELDKVRDAGGDMLSVLSRNTRYQMRRSLKAYEARGPLRLRAAASTDEALSLFDQLRLLHQRHWTAKGHRGAFASAFAREFHSSLIRSRFPAGEIQLLEILVGDCPIGYLYNFVKNDVVYSYQSSFSYEDDPRLKPGLLSHYQAVQYNVSLKRARYDFLMGDQQYKRSLATDQARMLWMTIQRKRLRFRVENALRRLRDDLKRHADNHTRGRGSPK